jgi:putative copper export protein
LNALEGHSSSFVASLALRSALAGAAGAVFAIAPRATAGFEDAARTRALLLGAVAACAGAVALTSASSHAAAESSWKPLGALFDFVHLGSAAFWAGSLAALVVLRGPMQQSPRLTRALLERFSRLALYAVGGVLIGGALLALVQLGEFGALFASAYGLLILGKASLFVPLAALGAHNHFRSIPSLRAAKETAEAAARRIARNVRAEVALAFAALLVASVLTAMAPAAPAPPEPSTFTREATSGDLRIVLAVTPPPGPPGAYTVEATLFGVASGLPDSSTRNATMTLRLQNSTLPPQTVALDGPHLNHYFTEPPQSFGQPGTWRIDLDFIRPGRADVTATFYITIASG